MKQQIKITFFLCWMALISEVAFAQSNCFFMSDCSDTFSIPGFTYGQCCDGRTGGYSVNGACISCSSQGECHKSSSDCGDSDPSVDAYGSCCLTADGISTTGSYRSPSGVCTPCSSAGCHSDDTCSSQTADSSEPALSTCCATGAGSHRSPVDGVCTTCSDKCHITTDNCGDDPPLVGVFSFEECCLQTYVGSYEHDGQCHPCSVAGCYKESDCFGFPDIISDDFGSCCAAGGTAYLDPLSEECTVCPAKQCHLSELCEEGGTTVQASSTTECCEKGGKSYSNGFGCLPACGVIEGDPHFIVPLLSKDFLCYSIQGYSGLTFNLIYNDAFTINAMFVNTEGDTSEATWIGKLAVIPQNSHRSNAVVFDSVKQTVTIVGDGSLNAATIKQITFTENGTAKFSKTMKKQIGNPIIRVMYVKPQAKFDVTFYKDHLNVDWSLNYDELHDSHGLMGQFMKKGINIDTKREMLIFSNGRDPVPVARDSVMTGKWCWKAKNYGNQGEGLIEGNVLDYLVPNILDVADKLKHLKSN